jgi:hypothetical protein
MALLSVAARATVVAVGPLGRTRDVRATAGPVARAAALAVWTSGCGALRAAWTMFSKPRGRAAGCRDLATASAVAVGSTSSSGATSSNGISEAARSCSTADVSASTNAFSMACA